MRIQFSASLGYVGATRREIVEIPDEELVGMTGEQQEKYIEDYFQEWLWNYLDAGWWEADEE